MKVRMLVGIAGPDRSAAPGEEWECGKEEAARLIDAGFADPVAKPRRGKTETAAEAAVETATDD